ncbi:TetR family transcriptional regulator [Kineosporia sp. NBRC 101677]|nr:TetR family transcriptional regulator [Kineosporia sp. NBRC 101677]
MPVGTLNQDAIVQAALEISRTEGLPGVTMRAVGARFGVTPMALYRHITDRPTLVRLVTDRIGTAIRPSAAPDAPWEDRVRAWAQAQRAVLRAHPGTAAWLIENGPSGPQAYRLLEYLASALADAGLDDARTARGTALVMSWTFSRISIEDAAELPARRPGRSQAFVDGLQTVDEADHPTAARIGPEFFTLSGEVVFETGLDWIVAGIRTEAPG